MGEVIVGDRTCQLRGKGICQAAPNKADILVAINREAHARRRGSDVHGLRERVVKVELKSVAELLPQARLQSMVARAADGAPSIHGKSLVIEEFTGAAVESRRTIKGIKEVGRS